MKKTRWPELYCHFQPNRKMTFGQTMAFITYYFIICDVPFLIGLTDTCITRCASIEYLTFMIRS